MPSLLYVVLTQHLPSWHLVLNTPPLTAIFKAGFCIVGVVSMAAIARVGGICIGTFRRFYQTELSWMKIRITWFVKKIFG